MKTKIWLIIFSVIISIGLIWKYFDNIDYGGNFTLNHNGNEWHHNKNSKKINLVYFGFTRCGIVCPATLNTAGKAFDKLSKKELENTRLTFVSVDYAYDKPNFVAQYAKNFFPEFIGVTGNKEQIDATLRLFPAGYINQGNQNSDNIIHTDKIFFLNKEGEMIDYITSPRKIKEVLVKIRKYQ